MWISIKQEFPKNDEWILGADSNRVEKGIWLSEEEGFVMPDLNYFAFSITHWMPLPKQPMPLESYWKNAVQSIPNNDDDILVSNGDSVSIGCYSFQYGKFLTNNENEWHDVKWWMELPIAPNKLSK